MNAALWVMLIVALIGAAASIISARIAGKAERNSRPVSNGFASGVIAQLTALATVTGEMRSEMNEGFEEVHSRLDSQGGRIESLEAGRPTPLRRVREG